MKVKQTVGLPSDDLDWYHREYPSYSLSATLTLLLREFRTVHKEKGVSPRLIAKEAATEVKSTIDEGIFEDSKGDEED